MLRRFTKIASNAKLLLSVAAVALAFATEAVAQPATKDSNPTASPLRALPIDIASEDIRSSDSKVVREHLTDDMSGRVTPTQRFEFAVQPKWALCSGPESFGPTCGCPHCRTMGEGSWHWRRDEEEERRRAIRIYNTQCVRCHGVRGKGVWDIPDVPDFTNLRWQQSRSDADIVRLTLGGRGACMPAFKGTITTDEAWAVSRYIRALGKPPQEVDLNPPPEEIRPGTPSLFRSR